MTAKHHSSLEELRAEKHALRQKMKSDMDILKSDVSDCFMPSNPAFVKSPIKYMNYVGYAITVYKTVTTIRGIFKFFGKRSR